MKKLGLRLSIIIMAIVALVIGTILIILMNTTEDFVDEMLMNQTVTANNSFASTLQGYQDDALQRAEMIAGSKDVANAVLQEDPEALLAALQNLSTGMDLITLCDAEGTVLVRTHSDKSGDNVLSQKAISIALNTGKGISTIEPGTVIGLSTRGSAAIRDQEGNIIGALTCGHDLSQSKYIDAVKAENRCEATFFAGDTRMSTTLIDTQGNRTIGTKASDAVVNTVIKGKDNYSARVDLFGGKYAAFYSPVIVDDQVIGMLFTGVNIDAALKQERSLIIMIIISASMLLIAVLMTAWIITSTMRKSYWYESMLDSIPMPISVTDMDMKWTFINRPVEQMLNVKRTDVLGKHCSHWGAGICKTENCGITCLRAGKQVTTFSQMGMEFMVNISYLYNQKGKQDGHIEIVQDITKMVASQKAQAELVGKITDVSGTFVNATKQIADGSQSLAQGSTQQAAAVEQLSASVSTLSQKTQDNAEMAGRAAALAENIKRIAEKGSHQMDEMMGAVQEINNAGQNISKVIGVIDSIAFQTNILALNAAVEAARAGQHGKGFAVVAEEVRSLAAKSADAAKDTGSLILNSIEKAELGSRIASETAASLTEIVSGINESTKLVIEIAQSSTEQSAGIAQINSGIDQVSQVVQQNSATAEQSAAAADQLSGQTLVLEDLLHNFGTQNELPPGQPKQLP